jgi:hypothetical protein
MSDRLFFFLFVTLMASVRSNAFADELTSRPKQYILHVRVCEGRPYRIDGSPEHSAAAINEARRKHQMMVLAEPNLLFTENKECHFSAGGELDAGLKKVGYGTALDVLARSKREDTIELSFVAEQSWPKSAPANDRDGDVMRIPGEKLCGKLRMRPGVVYRVSGDKRENGETWWEFQIEQASK